MLLRHARYASHAPLFMRHELARACHMPDFLRAPPAHDIITLFDATSICFQPFAVLM